jgi:cell division septation protein DedD
MVSFEQILFTAIGGLIAVVIAFSLGVEKGKSITQSYENHMVETRVAAPILPLPEKVVHKEEAKEIALQASEPKGEESKGYTIQVASYKNKKSVEKLVVEFHSKGQKSFSLPKGEFMIVCVGNYPNPTDASKTAKTLKKQFPDCFVRKL